MVLDFVSCGLVILLETSAVNLRRLGRPTAVPSLQWIQLRVLSFCHFTAMGAGTSNWLVLFTATSNPIPFWQMWWTCTSRLGTLNFSPHTLLRKLLTLCSDWKLRDVFLLAGTSWSSSFRLAFAGGQREEKETSTWAWTSQGTHILDTSGTIMNFEWKARLNTWYLVGWTSHDIGCECNFNLGGLMLLVSLLLIGVGWTLKFRFLQMLWIQPQMILQWRCMIKTTTWVWFNFIGRRFHALQICKIL